MLWGIYRAICGEVNVSVEKCVENKGRLCWKIANLFYFCHLKKVVRPVNFGPCVCHNNITINWKAVSIFFCLITAIRTTEKELEGEFYGEYRREFGWMTCKCSWSWGRSQRSKAETVTFCSVIVSFKYNVMTLFDKTLKSLLAPLLVLQTSTTGNVSSWIGRVGAFVPAPY